MSKQVDFKAGLDKLTNATKETDKFALSHQWQMVRNNLDSILMSNNVMKSDAVRAETLKLDHMSHEDRCEYIRTHWGPAYLNACMGTLIQLKNIEAKAK